jgi:hypothetical protein
VTVCHFLHSAIPVLDRQANPERWERREDGPKGIVARGAPATAELLDYVDTHASRVRDLLLILGSLRHKHEQADSDRASLEVGQVDQDQGSHNGCTIGPVIHLMKFR